MSDENGHPGQFIKTKVIPAGISVTKAAAMMGVGRPALSNLLNGKAALSQEMALRLEKAFAVDRELLLDKQRAYDEEQNRHLEKKIAVKAYAPSFLDITAEQIEAWADKVEGRALLPALLRRLVTTTGTSLSKVDFPAYDNAQRHGWDGQVETDAATPWTPSGVSGWEFGCDQNPKRKAEQDYSARVRGVAAAERKNMTFVFVTPRNWPGKEAWAKRKATDGHWKDVKAFDASDLEQWLEQSVPAQAWLAEKLGIKSDDVLSLSECWNRWATVTEPVLSKELLAGAVATHNRVVVEWLNMSPQRPLIVTSEFGGGVPRVRGMCPRRRRRRRQNGGAALAAGLGSSNKIVFELHRRAGVARRRGGLGRHPQVPAHSHHPQAERRGRRAGRRARSRR